MPSKTDGSNGSSKPDLAPITFLTGGGPLYWILANALVDEFGPITIIQEEPEPTRLLLSRRLKRLGLLEVSGQVAFAVVLKMLQKLSQARRERIVSEAGADARKPSTVRWVNVPSVNSTECREALKAVEPKVVIVVGTRIIGSQTLNCVKAPFINYHPGKTPEYRGMNGGYWTLANCDEDNLAVTLHLIDAGVDTGPILYQKTVAMPSGNNISTYHYQLATEAAPIAVAAVRDALNDNLSARSALGTSRQWFHPTLWGYLWTGLTRRVW